MRAQFFRFAIAGAIGFLVDAGVLYVALAIGLGAYAGRVVSFLCAAFTTWQINRRLTFEVKRTGSLWREWLRYLAAMSVGGGCNYGSYVVALLFLPKVPIAPLIAVGAGSIAGMFVNFAFAKLWVFRAQH
ncbi:Putative flippase GtrA (transmembrane translocase of bactoprenol-linked glucose) [Burkholderia sp. WP9]|uniref:GtrA family protein n=1 Tax=Burkholderia sp. WP9 TaxID=1500263 RepID=UPI00089C06E2|nr:GtrA family protein [Burkholderia sp. WP9]SED05070.1 Putative flippase GtrA (transmembrane translocase of bactoprenol-linked glucose) [Burkholderia sp. WP9]